MPPQEVMQVRVLYESNPKAMLVAITILALAVAIQTVRSWWYRKLWRASLDNSAGLQKVIEELQKTGQDILQRHTQTEAQLWQALNENATLRNNKTPTQWPTPRTEDWPDEIT